MRVLLTACLAFPLAVLPLAAQVAPTRYDSIFDQLIALPALPHRAADVRSVTLRREAAEIALDSGRLYLLGPVGARHVGAVFVGRGRFSFVPPIRVEREQLRRALKHDELKRPFGRILLLFADSTAAELGRSAPVSDQPVPMSSSFQGAVRKGLDFVSHRGRRYFDANVIAPFLNGETNETFFAMMDDAPDGPFLFQVDPYEAEEVSLSVGKAGESLTDNRSEVVSRFHWSRDSSGASSRDDAKDRLTVQHYSIDAGIARSLEFRAAARLRLSWSGAARDWFPLYLFPDLRVDSARWEGTGGATVVRSKGNPILWVNARADAHGQPLPDLVIHYHGDLLTPDGPWIDLKTSSGWYPSTGIEYGRRATATFDLRFRTPKNYKFASIGERVERRVTGDVLATRWVTTEPSFHASFNIGTFEELELDNPRSLPVTVLINEEAHSRIPSAVQRRDGSIEVIPRQANMKEAVGEDVALSLAFFRDFFGDPPTPRFWATEISGGHGQAFPGLIHFSWATYHGFLLERGEDESFRAHEVAHQWWGLGVVPQSYRDAWISEGFATFASWWYTEAILGDSGLKVLSEVLKRSKERVIARRQYAGPIWLGTRIGTGTRREDYLDYATTIYDKGAWVLRMLRYLMRDSAKIDEEPFRQMLRDFYQRHRGGVASTADFQAIVEQHFKAPMDWFFNSWVYGTGIPTYQWAHRTETGPDGKLITRFRVTQRNVPEDFAMVVPARLEMPGGQAMSVRITVKGPSTETGFEVPSKPARVILNPDHAVLADVKEGRWR